jgi:hypothetical protein
MEATFKDVKKCVQLLMAGQASASNKPSTQIAQKPPPSSFIKLPLGLVVGKDHAALDPRTSFRWGQDIHRTCVSSFLDPLATDERSELAQMALQLAISHNMCPPDSIQLLCEHSVGQSEDLDSQTESCALDMALYDALRVSAAEAIILILLDHGANPNAERYTLPLITAINSKASEAVLTALLQRGADPNLRYPKFGLTPHEWAKKDDRQDVVALFTRHDTVSKLSDLKPSRSTGPGDAEASLHRNQSSRSPASLTVRSDLTDLTDMDEVNELDDLGKDILDESIAQSLNDPKDSVGSSRLWFSGIPSIPIPRFRSNSKQK